LNEGPIPNLSGVRVHVSTGYSRVRGKSAGVAKRLRERSPTRNLHRNDSPLLHRCAAALAKLHLYGCPNATAAGRHALRTAPQPPALADVACPCRVIVASHAPSSLAQHSSTSATPRRRRSAGSLSASRHRNGITCLGQLLPQKPNTDFNRALNSIGISTGVRCTCSSDAESGKGGSARRASCPSSVSTA
jgi:hypothetical protein